MSRQLFGTDGIRGVAGQYPLDPQTVFAFGRALGEWAGAGACVLIGMDTRESGPELTALVTAGLAKAGVGYEIAGVLPTPGVAWLTKHGDYKAGLMISASHNPFGDNGLKVFSHSGYKLPDSEELLLEQRIFALRDEPAERVDVTIPQAGGAYVDYLESTFPYRLDGWRIVVDGGNGAASYHAPELLTRLGAEVIAIHCSPNGRNINFDCGALHTEEMRESVVAHGANLGVSFDGDADRAMFACASGRAIDGDHVLLICGSDLDERGLLPGRSVVATVMSNLGLELALRRRGIELVRTAVGDKYVLEEMVRRGAVIGGEQSGHVIFHREATTGDGILSLLRLMDVLVRKGESLEDLAGEMTVLPQKLVNVRFEKKRPIDELETVQRAIRECETEFGAAGRVLVRFSGTEPLARVMVEGTENNRVGYHAQRIAAAIQEELAR